MKKHFRYVRVEVHQCMPTFIMTDIELISRDAQELVRRARVIFDNARKEDKEYKAALQEQLNTITSIDMLHECMQIPIVKDTLEKDEEENISRSKEHFITKFLTLLSGNDDLSTNARAIAAQLLHCTPINS